MASCGFMHRTKCFKVEICCKCCGQAKCYNIEVPCNTIIAQASLSTPLAYNATAVTTIIFNTVTLNEGGNLNNPCFSCQQSPCCCRKKKKKCKSSSSSSSGCGSCRRSNCGGCQPQCPPYGCNPYPGGWCPPPNCGGCPPMSQFGGPWNWQGQCQFYNPSTGIATVPYCGGGYYQITVTATTTSVNTTTMALKINGATTVSTTMGTATGSMTGVISTQQLLNPGATVYVSVQDDTGAATITAANLTIVRLY